MSGGVKRSETKTVSMRWLEHHEANTEGRSLVNKADLKKAKSRSTKRERKFFARRRSITRYCEIMPGETLGGYCSSSRLLAGHPVCIVFTPCKSIEGLKACPMEKKK